MGNAFGKKIPLKDLIKQNKRQVSKAIRELDRERARMESDEKKLVRDIQTLAKKGQMKAVKIQAMELVRTKNFINKFLQMRAHLNSVLLKIQVVKSHEAMAGALKGTTAAMVKINKQMNVPAMQKIMTEFQKQEMLSAMTMDMMGDTMDEMMEGSDDEDESDAIVAQVLDEIGVDLGQQLAEVPVGMPPVGTNAVTAEPAAAVANSIGAGEGVGGVPVDSAVSELEARLNNLRRD